MRFYLKIFILLSSFFSFLSQAMLTEIFLKSHFGLENGDDEYMERNSDINWIKTGQDHTGDNTGNYLDGMPCVFFLPVNADNLVSVADCSSVKRLHASYLRLDNMCPEKKPHIILAQSPNKEDPDHIVWYLRMLFHHGGALIALTSRFSFDWKAELPHKVYIDNNHYTLDLIPEKPKEDINEPERYFLENLPSKRKFSIAKYQLVFSGCHERTIPILMVGGCQKEISKQNYATIFEEAASLHFLCNQHYQLIIHCTTGRGISGTLACSLIIEHCCEKQAQKNLEDTQRRIVEHMLRERSYGVIQTPAQYDLIYGHATESLMK